MKKWMTVSLLMFFPCYSYAENNVLNTTTQNSTSQNSAIINSNGNAKEWNLSEKEWDHYVELMRGKAGKYYAHLTPPEVLGILAETDEERHHYADIYVRAEHDKVERELRFDRAFHDAGMKLYANEPIIKSFDISPYSPTQRNAVNKSVSIQNGDHIALFIDIKNNDGTTLLNRLIDRVKSHASVILDIYLVNAIDNNDIQKWAKAKQIPFDYVLTNRITLNNDNGKFKHISGSATLPYVVLIHDGKSNVVDMEVL